jgi:isopenicillin N synthase-like dioxygenase
VLQAREGYFRNGCLYSAGEVFEIPQNEKITVIWKEPPESIKITRAKSSEERMAAWKEMQEICREISVPEDFDYKKELAKARDERYGRFD